jgi:hypothetical protein
MNVQWGTSREFSAAPSQPMPDIITHPLGSCELVHSDAQIFHCLRLILLTDLLQSFAKQAGLDIFPFIPNTSDWIEYELWCKGSKRQKLIHWVANGKYATLIHVRIGFNWIYDN